MIRPAVSIVMPVYNGRRYLAESIESVLAQTWTDFEFVICDDGSSDDSYQMCASYRDPRIRLLRNAANRGLFPNLNRLVGESRAPIVRFWSQDDRMKPNCLRAEQEFRAAHDGVALTYCQRDTIDERGAVVARPAYDPTPEVIEPWLSNQIAVYHGCLQGNIATVAVRRSVLDEAGPFAEHFRVSGDFEMWTRISARHPIGFIRDPLIDLRAHRGQFSRSPRERLAFIREDRAVVERLLADLEPDVQRYARAYRRRHQDLWTMHYLAGCVARGDWSTARQVVGELRRTGPVLPLLARWLVTANGAWFRPEPAYRKPAPAVSARSPGAGMYATRRPIRITAVLTHPIQYYTPWFRNIQAHAPELDLTVLYATEPTPDQQGVGFGRSFEWDVPLRAGYRSCVLRPPRPGQSVSSEDFRGIDVPEVGEAIVETAPDVVIVPGWYSVTLVRALRECRRRGIPVLYRGDTHSKNAPSGWRALAWRLKTGRLLRAYAGYLCPGQRVRDHLVSFGVPPSRIFHTPHCVDNAFFAEAARSHQTTAGRAAARAAFGIAPDRFVVLFAGKLTQKKRPLDVIRAVAPRAADSTVLIVGGGPLEEACRQEAARLGVQVAWAGFLNQSEIARAYACADCLALPSDWGETWGLVVNEALAVGVPCVVSDRVGCAPDLVDDTTGAVFSFGDVVALGAAIERVRARLARDSRVPAACRARAAQVSVSQATRGLVAACREVAGRSSPRVVACFGHMVDPGGLERMSFEVLSALTERGAAVHCIFNPWENARVVAAANRIGATWQTGSCWCSLRRRPESPLAMAQVVWDIAATSRVTFRAGRTHRATHVFVPDYAAVARNMIALAWLRLLGVQVILRLGQAPEPDEVHRRLWRRLIAPLADRVVGNSAFIGRELLDAGVPASKVSVIPIEALASLEKYDGRKFADAWWRVFAPYALTPPTVGVSPGDTSDVPMTEASPGQVV